MKPHRAFKSFLALLVLIAAAGECFAQDGTPKPFPAAAPGAAVQPPPLDENSPFRDVPRTDPAYADLKTVGQVIPKPQTFGGMYGPEVNSPAFDRLRFTRYEFAVTADRALKHIMAMPEGKLRDMLLQSPDCLPALTRLLTTFEWEGRVLGMDPDLAKAILAAKAAKAAKAAI